MLQHDVSQEEIIRGCREQKMKDLIFDLASVANMHLETVSIVYNKLMINGYVCDILVTTNGHLF